VWVWVCVCVCMCVYVCVCVYERVIVVPLRGFVVFSISILIIQARHYEWMSECVVCVWVCVRVRVRVCACVCVCRRGKQRKT